MPSAATVARRFLARTELSRALERVAGQMERGSWGNAAKVLREVLGVLGVAEHSGEIGVVHTVGVDWYYALGPKQKTRAKRIVEAVLHLLRWVKEDSAAEEMASQMRDLAKEVAWLERVKRSPGDAIKHGPFDVIPMRGVSRAATQEILGALDKATAKVRPKFPQVLYGKVYVSKSLRSVAQYTPDDLYISLKAKSTVGDVHAICHELGHRYYTKFWKDRGQKEEFRRLSTEPGYKVIKFDGKLRKRMADELIDLLHDQQAGRRKVPSELLGKWLEYLNRDHLHELRRLSQAALGGDEKAERELHKKVSEGKGVVKVQDSSRQVRGPLLVTSYGEKSWIENFCEAFAHYVLGQKLPAELAGIMSKLK